MDIRRFARRFFPPILFLLANTALDAQAACTVECVTAAFCSVPGGGPPGYYYYSLEYFTSVAPCRTKIAQFRSQWAQPPFPNWCVFQTGDPDSTFAGIGTKLHVGPDQGGTIAVNDDINDFDIPQTPPPGPPCDFTPNCSVWQPSGANCFTSTCDVGEHNITLCNTPFPAGNGWSFQQPPGNSCAPTQAATMLMRICGVCLNPSNWSALPCQNTFGNTANALLTALQQYNCGCRQPTRVTCQQALESMYGGNGCEVIVSPDPPVMHWITVTNGTCSQTDSGWAGTVQWAGGDGSVGTFSCSLLYDACSAAEGILGAQGGGVCLK